MILLLFLEMRLNVVYLPLLKIRLQILLPFNRSLKKKIVDCTATGSAHYRVGIRPQTSLIAAICYKAGVDLDDVTVSRSTVHRKRLKKIEELGELIRQDIMTTLRGKKLCLHFDGKQIQQIEENLNITVTAEQKAVSVTSPDIEDTDDILLGVVQAESSK